MVMQIVVHATCNACGLQASLSPSSLAQNARTIINEAGWLWLSAVEHLCPQCGKGSVIAESNPHPELIDVPPIHDDYSPELLAVGAYRLWVIRPLVGAANRTKEQVRSRVEAVRSYLHEQGPWSADQQRTLTTSVSVSSVYRWLRTYKHSGYDWQSLIPNSKRQGRVPYTDLEAEAIMQAVIEEAFASGETFTVEGLWGEVAIRIDEYNQQIDTALWVATPSKNTVWQRITTHNPERNGGG